MRTQRRWLFRILFLLTVIYHVWVLIAFGGDYVVNVPWSFPVFVIVNIINWAVQFGLPIWFFYRGFIKK